MSGATRVGPVIEVSGRPRDGQEVTLYTKRGATSLTNGAVKILEDKDGIRGVKFVPAVDEGTEATSIALEDRAFVDTDHGRRERIVDVIRTDIKNNTIPTADTTETLHIAAVMKEASASK